MMVLPKYILAALLVAVTGVAATEQRTKSLLDHKIAIHSNEASSVHAYWIIGARPDTVRDLLAIIRNPNDQQYWEKAFNALGVIVSVDKSSVRFSDLSAVVENFEAYKDVLDPAQFLPTLGAAYGALGRSGYGEAYDFLRKRIERDFWGTSIPRYDYPVSESTAVATLTAQTEAIRGMAYDRSQQAEDYLTALQSTPPFNTDPVLARTLTTELRLRPLEEKLQAERENAFAAAHSSSSTALDRSTFKSETASSVVANTARNNGNANTNVPIIKPPLGAQSSKIDRVDSFWRAWGVFVVIGAVGILIIPLLVFRR